MRIQCLKTTSNFPLRLKANALIITVMISVVLAILSSALILLAYYNRGIQADVFENERLDRNLNSAVQIVLNDTITGMSEAAYNLDLFHNGTDSAIVENRNWGIFRLGKIRVFDRRNARFRNFLFGNMLPDYFNGCVYLVDHNQALSISGNTLLKGDGYLPKTGIQPSYIDQQGYSRDKLIDGKILRSLSEAPSVDANWTQHFDSAFIAADHFIISSNSMMLHADSIIGSFNDSLILIRSPNRLTIDNIKIAGHIMIVSDSSIELGSASKIENIIVISPVVRVKNGFTGSLQIISADSVIVEDNCVLKYPSAIIMLKRKGNLDQNYIEIKENCEVHGALIALADNRDKNKSRLTIGDSSVLNGIVYVNGYTVIKGRVRGSVLSDYFLYRKGSSYYLNHLVDAEIDRSLLSQYFVGPVIFSERKPSKIIEWLK